MSKQAQMLKRIQRDRRITQAELARLLHVSPSHICKIVSGERELVGIGFMEDLQDLGLGVGAELLGVRGPGKAGAEEEEKEEGKGSGRSVSVFVSANRDDRGRAGTARNLISRGESSLMGG